MAIITGSRGPEILDGAAIGFELGPEQVSALRDNAESTLAGNVTEDRIYASADLGMSGPYNCAFGRDSLFTLGLVTAAELRAGNFKFAPVAATASIKMLEHQAPHDDPSIGMYKGGLFHEFRHDRDDVKRFEARMDGKKFPRWNVVNGQMINYDSIDATPLAVINLLRYFQATEDQMPPQLIGSLRSALEFCLHNLERYSGFAGFTRADQQPEREVGGLHNQSWKDSWDAYLDDDGEVAEHPIHDVAASAYFWAAFKYGANLFSGIDRSFANVLGEEAAALKTRFNSPEDGFLMRDDRGWYFAEALDGNLRQLQATAIDPAKALWANYGGETIIDDKYVPDVVNRIMQPDMFTPRAGIRTYSSELTNYRTTNLEGKPYKPYHRHPRLHWHFVPELIANGLRDLGAPETADQISQSVLRAIAQRGCNAELSEELPDGTLAGWKSTENEQTDATEQTWTAAAVKSAAEHVLAHAA